MKTWQKSLASHARRVLLLAIATSLIGCVHAWLAPEPQTLLEVIYLWTIPIYFVILVGVIGVLTLPFAIYRITRFVWGLASWLFLGYLVANLGVFNLYGFHIDLVLLKMFVFDFKGMGIPTPLIVLSLFVFVILGGMVALGYRACNLKSPIKAWLNNLGVFFISAALPVFFVNQGIHAWGQTYHQTGITQYTPFFPLFYPTESSHSIKQLAQIFPELIPSTVGEESFFSSNEIRHKGRLYFPKAPLTCEPPVKKNLILIVLESWQAKSFRSDSMPHLTSLLEEATFFKKHISSGTATVPGFFGLFYGLHPSYYEAIRSQVDQYPAPLTQVAERLGYDLRVFSSGDLERFSLRKMFFSRVDDNFYYLKDDDSLVRKYGEVRKRPSTDPTFDVLYLTSSHSPYSYPEGKSVFQPLPKVEGAYVFDKTLDPKPFRNDYLNSLFYLDSLIGSLLKTLKESGAYEDTWIVITGDHGEEFNESGLGFWGHGSNFSQWQTATPLILRAPGQRRGELVEKPTFHQDVAPTLMQDVLGCSNVESDFSNGHNLRKSPVQRHAVIKSYVTQAYWIDDYIWERNTGRHYSWEDISISNKPIPPSDRLKQLLLEESLFIRP